MSTVTTGLFRSREIFMTCEKLCPKRRLPIDGIIDLELLDVLATSFNNIIVTKDTISSKIVTVIIRVYTI